MAGLSFYVSFLIVSCFSVLEVLCRRKPEIFGFMQFTFGTSTPLYYLASYVQTEGGATAAQGATVTSMFGAGTIFGRILLGQLADWKGCVTCSRYG